MPAPKRCIVCRKGKPEVPDRNRPGRPIKRLCRSCHGKRLIADLDHCYALELERRARAVTPWPGPDDLTVRLRASIALIRTRSN